jgi:PIN domain nuclease of toxin-antitoxin system
VTEPEDGADGGDGGTAADGETERLAVLDASAVLAWLRGEPGAALVEAHLDGAVISAVNVAEVHQKLAQHGVDADATTRRLRGLGVRVEPFYPADAVLASRLWPYTRAAGLSLGDRCCLALAVRLTAPALTADKGWTRIDLTTLEQPITVVPIR